ncbi:MAG: ABC transporter permease [Spirochaetes bacterium]|nr:ABC transporter permease [Spirochaetota bacterium]
MKPVKHKTSYPSFIRRIYSVWYRHIRVYTKHLLSNGLPPFLEPLIFLAGIGIGLGMHIKQMDGIPYIAFLASAIMAPPAMFTAAFECSFGTFIRLEYDKVYDGMIGASITVKDLFLGEILFAGTKGFFFSAAVLLIISLFGLASYPTVIFAPIAGFLTGLMFASFSLFITSFVKTINHFNFYFTGFLTPMFFFSGLVFPLSNIPEAIRWIAELLPLAHSVRVIRVLCLNTGKYALTSAILLDIIYMLGFIILFTYLAIKRIERKIID